MEFDRTEFLSKYLRRGPEVLADELHALHAEIDVLKARLPEPKPARETGWAVITALPADTAYFCRDGWTPACLGPRPLWLDSPKLAAALAVALREGREALLYKDTLEEVE